jgi:tetratricopeptide (TPR) repeat protein
VQKLFRIITLLCIALTLVNCSRDPQVVKKKYLESGNKYFDRGKYREASIMYRRALNTDQKYGEAYYKLALTALKLGQPVNAVPWLRRAVELLPKSSAAWKDANLSLGEILLVAAQSQEQESHSKPLLDEAAEIAKLFLAQDPNSFEGHKLTANLKLVSAVQLYKKKDLQTSKAALEEGIKEYRLSLASKPGDTDTTLALARALALYGEAEEAVQLFRTSIDKNPNTSTAYVELYRIYVSQRKLVEAEELLKKAIAANPKDFTYKTLLAAHYFSNGNRPAGVKLLDEMKANFKDYPRAYFTAGDFYLRVQDTESAIKNFEEGAQKDKAHKIEYQKKILDVLTQQGKMAQAYEKDLEILKENPKDPEARGLKAQFLLDKGDVNQAVNELQTVVTARPDNFVARYQLGRAHFAKQEYEQASQEFEKAIQLRQDYLPPRLALAQVALARGENETALRISQDIIRINPDLGAARLLGASAQMRMGNYKESRATLQAILTSNPKQAETRLELGVLDLLEKKYDEAAMEFRQAYDIDPSNLRGLMGQTEAYVQEGKPDLAVSTVKAEVSRFPNRNDIKRDLGDTEFRTGHLDEAIQTYKAILPLYKDNPKLQGDLFSRMGDASIRKKDIPTAIEQLQKAHDLEPDAIPVTNTLALLLEGSGKHTEARKLYQESISRKGDDPEALNNLAYLIAETGGNLDEALTLATRAKQKLPNYPEISDTIGWIYLKKNLADSAIDIFRDITTKVPGNSTYHYHYAIALLQKGDHASAMKQCQLALDSKPKDRDEENHIRELMSKI